MLYRCDQARIGWKGLASSQINVTHKGNIHFLIWNRWKTVTNNFLVITEIINSHMVVKAIQQLLTKWTECFGIQLQKFRGLCLRVLTGQKGSINWHHLGTDLSPACPLSTNSFLVEGWAVKSTQFLRTSYYLYSINFSHRVWNSEETGKALPDVICTMHD